MYRRKTARKPSVKMVQKVARRVLLKNTETKRNIIMNEAWNQPLAAPGSSLFQYSMANIFSQLSLQGTGQDRYVGDQILDPMLSVRAQFTIDWSRFASALSPAAYPLAVCLHMWIISTNDQYALTTPTNTEDSSLSFIINWFMQKRAFRAQMNGDTVRVLRHWSRVVEPPSIPTTGSASAAQTLVKHKLTYRWKGKKTYEPTVPGGIVPGLTLKGNNYYLVCGYGIPDGVFTITNPNTVCSIYVDRYLYFKDP